MITNTTASVESILHKGEQRIKVIIANLAHTKALIKQVEGRRWSQTKGCWHIPHTSAAYQQLKKLFDEVLVIKKETNTSIESQTVLPKKTISSEIEKTIDKSTSTNHFINIEAENEHRMKVFVPYWRKNEIAKIKTIQGRAWNIEKKYWSVPMSRVVVEQLNTWFVGEIHWAFEVEKIIPLMTSTSPVVSSKEIVVPFRKVELGNPIPSTKTSHSELKKAPNFPAIDIAIPKDVSYNSYTRNGQVHKVVTGQKIILAANATETWLYAFVPFDKKGWQEVVNNIPGRQWMSDEKCWRLPYVKASFRLLKKYVGMEYLQILFKINADIPEEATAAQRFENHPSRLKNSQYNQLNDIQKSAVTLLVEKLTLERLAYSTIKSYKHHLAGLLLFYKNLKPDEITKKQLEHYLLHLIRFKKISESTQNQIINAVKAYWERVLNRSKEWIDIPRPKKPKKLPNVLSTEEIIDIIEATENLKHKLALLLIYSSGLRKGELLNLLKKDINIKRRSIHIKGGKGKKDRYVLLAETVVPYLTAYLKQYRPNRWLFEGQYDGKYSATSLHKIFKKAVEKSKANPYSTLHTLRHSYATHCVENGHNLKSVQEALGHESLKTTEIYLHISSHALKKLKSPLDNLDFK